MPETSKKSALKHKERRMNRSSGEEGVLPGGVLPIELWELIFCYLGKSELARLCIVCSSFHKTIQRNEALSSLLTRYNFDLINSVGVVFLDDSTAIRNDLSAGLIDDFYPNWATSAAFVLMHGRNPELVHFKVTDSGGYFCISVTDKRRHMPAFDSQKSDVRFALSYFDDGDLHSFGMHCCEDRRPPEIPYKSGDIISVQVGTCPKDCIQIPHGPWIELTVVPKKDDTPSTAKQGEVPYCIFYTNGKVVYCPFLLPGENWPLYICAYFSSTKASKVQIVQVPDMKPLELGSVS